MLCNRRGREGGQHRAHVAHVYRPTVPAVVGGVVTPPVRASPAGGGAEPTRPPGGRWGRQGVAAALTDDHPRSVRNGASVCFVRALLPPLVTCGHVVVLLAFAAGQHVELSAEVGEVPPPVAVRQHLRRRDLALPRPLGQRRPSNPNRLRGLGRGQQTVVGHAQDRRGTQTTAGDFGTQNAVERYRMSQEYAEGRTLATMPADATDTSRCPLGTRCECCGSDAPDLTVATATTALGVLCLTACSTCASALRRGTPPPVSAPTAVRLVNQHRRHLAR